jgi:hypothetical protein
MCWPAWLNRISWLHTPGFWHDSKTASGTLILGICLMPIPLGNRREGNLVNPKEEMSESRHLVSYREGFLGAGQSFLLNYILFFIG